MARLIAPGAGSLGMGTPTARYGLLTVVLLYAVNGVIVGYLAPGNPLAFAAYVLMAIANLLLTEQSERPLAAPRAAALIGCALLAGATVLFTDTEALEPELFGASLLILGLLAVRGNGGAAVLGAGAFVIVGVLWAVAREIPPALAAVRFLSLLALPAGILWRLQAVRFAEREGRYRSEAAQAEFAAEVAREAARRTAAELRVVRDEAVDVLDRLRGGLPVAESELSMVEASIRDRIRAPQLQTERLRSAVRDARERGVRVLQMGQAADLRPPISDALARAVAEILDRVIAGEVTIRLLSARHAAAITVLAESPESTELHWLDSDGHRIPDL